MARQKKNGNNDPPNLLAAVDARLAALRNHVDQRLDQHHQHQQQDTAALTAMIQQHHAATTAVQQQQQATLAAMQQEQAAQSTTLQELSEVRTRVAIRTAGVGGRVGESCWVE